MSALIYYSGETIQAGDRVRYHGEKGYVDFVVTEESGNETYDWSVEEYPGGGVMIVAEGFGNVFIDAAQLDDFLEFVGRSSENS